jgi:hypothetical protein
MPIADFGTNYTGIGWLTLVLPLALLIIVVVWWRIAWSKGSANAPDVPHQAGGLPSTATPPQSGAVNKPTSGDAAAFVPLLPLSRVLPLGIALAISAAIVVAWWWYTTRRAPS